MKSTSLVWTNEATHRRPGRETTPSHVTKDSPTLPRRDRLRSRGEHPWPAAKPRETTHLWPAAKHEGDIPGQDDTPMGSSEPSQRWQQMEATDASHQHIATASQPRLRRRGERPWPGSTPLRLRSRGRQHFPGQTPTLHTCEAEGDNTSLARYYTFTSAKPRDDPGQTPHHHTATAHGSASQIQKIVHENISQIKKIFHNIKPSPSSRTSAADGDNQY